MYIMLSIHPEYAEKIFTGQKKWEYRKTLPKAHFMDTTGVIVYATAPVSRVVGHFETDLRKAVGAVPENLWRLTNGATDGGIAKEEFDKYFEGHGYGYAIPVQKTVSYRPGENCVQPTLEDFGLTKPPQGFAYLTRVKNFMHPKHQPLVFNTLMVYDIEQGKHAYWTNVTARIAGIWGEPDTLWLEWDESQSWDKPPDRQFCRNGGTLRKGDNKVLFSNGDGHHTVIIQSCYDSIKAIIEDTETRETIEYYFAHNVYKERIE